MVIVVGVYFITRYALGALEQASIEDRKDELERVDRRHLKVVEYSSQHEDTKEKEETINNFIKGEDEQ